MTMTTASSNIESSVEEKFDRHGDDDELEMSHYDGVCNKCGGRTRSTMDHFGDLIERVAKSKKTCALQLLNLHLPLFVKTNMLLTMHCSICHLHFEGMVDFVRHLYHNRTQKGHNADGPHVFKWTAEIGTQHAQLMDKFLALLKKISSEGAHMLLIPMFDSFICTHSVRYFENAFFNKHIPSNGYVCDTGKDAPDLMVMELEWRSNRKKSTKGYEVENRKLNAGPFLDKFDELSARLDGVSKNSLKTIQEGLTVKVVRDNASVHLIKCLKCMKSVPSMRYHILNVLFTVIAGPNDAKSRQTHIDFLMGNTNTRIDHLSFFCPVCFEHFHGYEKLFCHLRLQSSPSKHQTNSFNAEHYTFMNKIIDLFVERLRGDISVNELCRRLTSTFGCPDGQYYVGPTQIVIQSKKRVAPQDTKIVGQLFKKRVVEDSGKKKPDFKMAKNGTTTKKIVSTTLTNVINICDLCGTNTPSNVSLRNHLRLSLFSPDNAKRISHLSCFPAFLVLNSSCVCPVCNDVQVSFAACLLHMGVSASSQKDKHIATANILINNYINCMGKSITLNDMTSFIRDTYKIK